MNTDTGVRLWTMEEIRSANARAGQHWFEPATMRFFRSRVGDNVYEGRYFISSEQFDWKSPRLYTIREIMPNGSIEEVGGFQQWGSGRQAVAALRRYLKTNTARISGIDPDSGRWQECSEPDCSHLANFRTASGRTPCNRHLFGVLSEEA